MKTIELQCAFINKQKGILSVQKQQQMENLFKRFSTLWYLGFLVTGCFLIFLYYYNLPPPNFITTEGDIKNVTVNITQPNLVFIVLKEIGIALCVAVFLAFTIEFLSHKRKELEEQKTGQDILEAVYRKYIPESTFAEFERCLLRGTCERTDYLIDYTIREFEDAEKEGIIGNDHYAVEIYSSYNIRNLLNEPVKIDLYFEIEVPVEEEYTKITEISSFKINGIQKVAEAKKPNHHGDCHVKFELELKPESHAFVEMHGVTAKRTIDQEVWASRIPSDGITICVRAPKHFDIHCKANNSHRMEKKGPNMWTLPHGIFPFQSVVLWWNGNKK